MVNKLSLTTLKLATLLFCSQSVMAENFSFTGHFNHDNDVQLFNFYIAAPSTTVSISTLSLNGGLNSLEQAIAGNGFNPYLALFNQTDGAWLFDTSAKALKAEAIISNNEANFYGILNSGHYVLALTQFDNIAVGMNLADGFADDLGLATFAPTPYTTLGGGGSNHWAIDISNVNTASVPTPAVLTLMLTGLVSFRINARRHQSPIRNC